MNVTEISHDRPQTPDDNNCCGNACNPCIFDIHKQLLEKWERNKNVNRLAKENILKPLSYKSFHVHEVNIVNSTYVIILLKYNEEHDSDTKICLNAGQHVMINISSWSKPITPIDWSDDTLKLLIRVYSTGLNTRKLKNIQLGTEVRVRGPYGEFQYTRNIYKNIIMFGIGSGIAALYPIAKSIIEDEIDETRVYLNIGFQTVDQVPLMRELKLLSDYWNVSCKLYVTQQDAEKYISGIDIEYGRINEEKFKLDVQNHPPNETMILICGNYKFNKSLEMWSKKYCFIHYHLFQ